MNNYGNGKSTGLDQTALGKINTGFIFEDMFINPNDKDIIRKLAN